MQPLERAGKHCAAAAQACARHACCPPAPPLQPCTPAPTSHPVNPRLVTCTTLAVGWLELRRLEAHLAERAAKEWEAELAQHEEQGYPSFKTCVPLAWCLLRCAARHDG